MEMQYLCAKLVDYKMRKKQSADTKEGSSLQKSRNLNLRKVTKRKWKRGRPAQLGRIMTSLRGVPKDFESQSAREAQTERVHQSQAKLLAQENNQEKVQLLVPDYGVQNRVCQNCNPNELKSEV